jgi:hypothetical protein
MKVWIKKEDLQILRNARDFGRTRLVEVSSFRRYKDENKEVEVELESKNNLIHKTKVKEVLDKYLKRDYNGLVMVASDYLKIIEELNLEEK